MADNWRKQWRKIWENPIFLGNSARITVWMWILDHTTWNEVRVRYAGKTITLKPGQLTCGSKEIGSACGVPESTVRRIIKLFESEQQIEHQTDHQTSLITVINWKEYNGTEQGTEQRVSSERATSERPVSTKEEGKKVKNEKNTDTPNGVSAEVMDEKEVEFRKFIDWLNGKDILKSKKQWSERAQKKWNRRRKEFSPHILAVAFANLNNDPRGWWVETNGHRPLHWWFDKEDRINDLLNCHKNSNGKQSTTHLEL